MLRNSAHPVADVAHHSLLVIEDALIHRTIISKIGDKVGFLTRTASSVEAAEALLRTQDRRPIDQSVRQPGGQIDRAWT